MAEIDINRIKNNNKSKMISRNNHVDINKYKRLPIPQTCENSETYDITADFIKIKEDKNGVQTFEAAIPLCPNQIKNPLLLRFDSVGYQTELFINEVYLKSHYGSYTTWECEIPDKMKADGTLAVRLQLKEGGRDVIQMAEDRNLQKYPPDYIAEVLSKQSGSYSGIL